jgi:AcrR family transcriptional regulator
MAPPTRTPRGTWIDAGLQALAAGGPSAVRIDALAKRLGVSRGGFYGHFEDHQAFLDALLETWETAAIDEVVQQVERRGGDSQTKIRRAGALTFSDELAPIDLAIRDWARQDPDVAARLRRVDNRRMNYLRSLFATFGTDPEDIEARSLLAFSLAIAHPLIAADHAGYTRGQALELALGQLVR